VRGEGGREGGREKEGRIIERGCGEDHEEGGREGREEEEGGDRDSEPPAFTLIILETHTLAFI